MSQKDLMKEWFKELPLEQPSPEFTVKIMQRVMSEWTLNPVKYQPIISKKGWWKLGFIAICLTSLLFMFHSLLSSETESVAQANTVYGLDLNTLLSPVGHLFEKLNNISPAVVIGVFAIIALWFFDQLFVRTVRRDRKSVV